MMSKFATFQKLTVKMNNVNCRSFSNLKGTLKAFKKSQTVPVSAYALLAIPVAAFGLGTWQVYRWRWKLDLIKALDEKTTAPAIELPEVLTSLNELEYHPIVVKGSFDHSREMYIVPRSLMPTVEDEKKRVSFMQTQPIGAHVVTPFVLADRNLTILVNRGWVPRNKVDPETRKMGQIEGPIQIVGYLRMTEKRMPLQSKAQSSGNTFYRREVEKMAKLSGACPIFLDLKAEYSAAEGPIGGQTRVQLRNEHFSYVLTWYGLSAATAYMWFRKYYSRVPL